MDDRGRASIVKNGSSLEPKEWLGGGNGLPAVEHILKGIEDENVWTKNW